MQGNLQSHQDVPLSKRPWRSKRAPYPNCANSHHQDHPTPSPAGSYPTRTTREIIKEPPHRSRSSSSPPHPPPPSGRVAPAPSGREKRYSHPYNSARKNTPRKTKRRSSSSASSLPASGAGRRRCRLLHRAGCHRRQLGSLRRRQAAVLLLDGEETRLNHV